MKLQRIDEQPARVETGPVQFGDDWPGVFLRGDDALGFAIFLRAYVQADSSISGINLTAFIRLLESCHIKKHAEDVC